ncbi:MAG: alpha/beta hydrolase [Mycobacterium kyogaense]|uniref:alpha/beta hydrolase n=1 Tax=Mycobacterium kyogaense TaxID=2212479 RepID=UPI002FF843C8
MADLDPVLAKVLDAVPFRLTTDGGPELARQRFAELPRAAVFPEVAATERDVAGPAGPVPVRIYQPPTEGPALPVVIFIHGGGWSVGDLDTYDAAARLHAVRAEALVVSVDYRLAPEHPYPAAVEDVWAATQWVAAHASELGGDATRLAVAGDSAGGNLAAVVAQLARDAGIAMRVQLLWYPSTTFDTSLPSFTENAEAPILGLAECKAFTRWYVGDTDLSQPPATLVPAVGDLTGVAPAHIVIAGHDPLRDDGARYAELLTAAGVDAHLESADTLVHGFLGYYGVVPAATEVTDRALEALRAALI